MMWWIPEMASRKPAFAHARPSLSHVSLGASSMSTSGFGKERHLLHRDPGGSTCSLGRKSSCPANRVSLARKRQGLVEVEPFCFGPRLAPE
jgi:hypothetical protein